MEYIFCCTPYIVCFLTSKVLSISLQRLHIRKLLWPPVHWQKLRHLKTQLYLRIKWRNVKTNWKTNNQKIRIQNWFPLIELHHQLDTTDTHHVCQIIGVTIFTDVLEIIKEENCHSKEQGREDNEHHTQPTVQSAGGGHLKSEWHM